jgi:hypothetical protein
LIDNFIYIYIYLMHVYLFFVFDDTYHMRRKLWKTTNTWRKGYQISWYTNKLCVNSATNETLQTAITNHDFLNEFWDMILSLFCYYPIVTCFDQLGRHLMRSYSLISFSLVSTQQSKDQIFVVPLHSYFHCQRDAL